MDSRFIPFLTLWTIIVIFLMYKSLSLSTFDNLDDAREFKGVVERQFAERNHNNNNLQTSDNQLLIRRSSSQFQDSNSSPVITPDLVNQVHPVLTTRKSTNEYARLSKVFILIIQNEDLRVRKVKQTSKRFKNANQPPSSSSSSTQSSILNENSHLTPNSIPAHIRLLISILDAHKIEYVIDSTRRGLPTSLLTDQDNVSENKLYSVIVIDDFIKYTKLNRWIRDQLDRHCRMNKIGVVTFLTNHELERQKSDNRRRRKASGAVSSSSSTEESLADQFPLTFKPILERYTSCKNSNYTASPCLFDYQLNELSPILRILKRRANFIIEGPLASNLNQSPWISMSSNHITYEPLTWAKYRRRSEKSLDRQSRHALNSEQQPANQSIPNLSGSANTHKRDQNFLTSQQHDLSSYFYSVSQPSEFSVRESELQIASIDQQQQQQQQQQQSSNTSSSVHKTSSFTGDDLDSELKVLSMYDSGLYDGIKRVIFGGANHIWLNRILLLDAIEHLSAGRIISPLDRYIQIDIDDIFVGERGTRLNRSDVDALVLSQQDIANRITGGFKFNLGYSGRYFKHGTETENEGDEHLVSRAQEFTWFCHTWSHSKAHLHNNTGSIDLELKRNINFASSYALPIIGRGKASSISFPTYAVAPHHSGVYPTHHQLYDSWHKVLNVQVTSTEEYPSLRPASGRRAFVHKTIKVLPRQTCGLYTHTIYRNKYPGGFEKLEANIKGGELFETILHNPVNIYMTHMSNYANDRLALYTFNELFNFVQMNTNLQLTYVPSKENQLGPAKLADYYFTLYPHESEPIWTNPCNDKRHLAIWSPQKHYYCYITPKLLIVGAQKTGTTALYTFLKLNPYFRSSQQSLTDFEEVQFFNDKHYKKGVDWYFQRFLSSNHSISTFATTYANNNNDAEQQTVYFFDKSATYFDDPKVPRRASSLLPEARIVILLVDPADRAYSWYQHIRAHGDTSARTYSFEQVIMAQDEQLDPALKALRNRCLHPGYYSQHLSRWLENYPSRQIIIIDGLWFKQNPISVMNRLQLILRVPQPLDYNQLLIYDPDKGFYCERNQSTGRSLCLGSSKGRKYAPMSKEARAYLNHLYSASNRQLARILSDIGQPLPTWLDEAVNVVNSIMLY